jgi:hypothetical protein
MQAMNFSHVLFIPILGMIDRLIENSDLFFPADNQASAPRMHLSAIRENMMKGQTQPGDCSIILKLLDRAISSYQAEEHFETELINEILTVLWEKETNFAKPVTDKVFSAAKEEAANRIAAREAERRARLEPAEEKIEKLHEAIEEGRAAEIERTRALRAAEDELKQLQYERRG